MKTTGFILTKNGKAEEAFELSEVTLPALKSDEVLIESEAFGLNYADVMARLGLYGETPPLPCVLGYEVVGNIIEVGKDVDAQLLNKRVVAFTRFGGYAKHAITKQYAVAIIDEMPVNEALSLSTQGVTAYYMTNVISPIQPNDNVLIHAAAGGVGNLLIQIAKQKNAKVFAKVGTDSKVEQALAIGADKAINYNAVEYDQEIIRTIGEKKMDVIFNPVGGSTFKKDMKLLNHGGRLMLFGGSELAAGKWGILSKLNFVRKMGIIIPAGLMIGSRSVLGVNMLKIGDNRPDILSTCLKGIIKLYQDGQLKPLQGGIYTANDFAKAHELLESGKSAGKITITW